MNYMWCAPRNDNSADLMNITKQMCGVRFNVDFGNFSVISMAFICTKICVLIIRFIVSLFGLFPLVLDGCFCSVIFDSFSPRSSIRIGISGLYCLTCHTPKYAFKLCAYLWSKDKWKRFEQMCVSVCDSLRHSTCCSCFDRCCAAHRAKEMNCSEHLYMCWQRTSPLNNAQFYRFQCAKYACNRSRHNSQMRIIFDESTAFKNWYFLQIKWKNQSIFFKFTCLMNAN